MGLLNTDPDFHPDPRPGATDPPTGPAWMRWVLPGLGMGAVLLLCLPLVGGYTQQNRVASWRAELRRGAIPPSRSLDHAAARAALPAPVARWLTLAVPDGTQVPTFARFDERVRVRTGDASPWQLGTAVEDLRVDRPGRVWAARVPFLPGLSVYAVEAFAQGWGRSDVWMQGLVRVAGAPPRGAPTREHLHSSALAQSLAHLVLVPEALGPEAAVQWRAIDDRTARLIAEDRDAEARLTVHFGDDGWPTRLEGTRAREVDGRLVLTGWRLVPSSWSTLSDVQRPGRLVAQWHTESGHVPYVEIDILDHALGFSHTLP